MPTTSPTSTSRSTYGSPPTWSSWACVSTIARTRLPDEVREVRQHEIDAEVLVAREGKPCVDDDPLALVLEDGHVLPDLAETAERDDAERLHGRSLRMVFAGLLLLRTRSAIGLGREEPYPLGLCEVTGHEPARPRAPGWEVPGEPVFSDLDASRQRAPVGNLDRDRVGEPGAQNVAGRD